ncbi:hypothetical protein Poli38472_006269 [Pythium oligandrum]|uniref:Uncharacterized protein n=1 Tax=Pythium oligandrum TaxID=41045 RepID=A0A8K1CUC4_PYTOL|nr:hypothetical protein Poli38472_006269 [Pythium oligandrum]|eukprot:TMW68801.1 hypothetical protein Poli38472_006269 [Pythium oligandrum]
MRCLPHCRLRWIALLLQALPIEAKRKSSISSLEEFWTFVAVIYGLVFLPVLFCFVYSLCRDPAAAEVLSLAKQWLTRKTLGFLSDGRDVSVHSQRLPPPSTSSSAISRKRAPA